MYSTHFLIYLSKNFWFFYGIKIRFLGSYNSHVVEIYFVFIFICFRRNITNSVCLCVHVGELDVTYLYTKDEPLNWNYQTFSYYFGFKYALGSVTLILGTPILKYFAISDHVMCLVGIVSKAAGCVLLSLSTTDTLIFIGKWTCYGNGFPSVRILYSASEPEQTAGFIGGRCISEVYRNVIMIIRLYLLAGLCWTSKCSTKLYVRCEDWKKSHLLNIQFYCNIKNSCFQFQWCLCSVPFVYLLFVHCCLNKLKRGN